MFPANTESSSSQDDDIAITSKEGYYFTNQIHERHIDVFRRYLFGVSFCD